MTAHSSPAFFSSRERRAALAEMARDGVDILVIGGGITGAAVALDAAVRGYRVGLVEKGDFASGTSSKSTKLVHGGIRYLPQFDFALVHEALVERGLLFQNAPWLVRPLHFVLPLYAWNKRPLGTPIVPPGGIGLGLLVRSGLWLYDRFAGRLNVQAHRRLSLADAGKRAPALKAEGLKDAFLYSDGQTDDARLTLTVLRSAVSRGALAANYSEVTGFDIEGGRIRAAHIRDTLSGEAYTIAAGRVVNAGGIFAQRIEELTGLPSKMSVKPAKGVHLVVSRKSVPMTGDAIVLPETDDGRLLFLVPWEERVLIGTTDTVGGDPDHPRTTEQDVEYLLDHCRRYLNVPLTRADILSVYAGYRPLIASASAEKGSAKLSRSHAVLDGPAGMVSIVGGKLTTWRRMAEDTLNHIGRLEGKPAASVTRDLALDGTEGWKETAREEPEHLTARYGSGARTLREIVREDQSRTQSIVPDLPYLLAEVVYACRYEMAMTLDDVLSRRTHIVLEDEEQGLVAARTVAAVMASELGWDDAEVERQIADYRAIVRSDYREQEISAPREAVH